MDLSASSVALVENSDLLAGSRQARLVSTYFYTPGLRLHAAVRHLFLNLAEWAKFGDWRASPATGELRQMRLRRFAGAALDRRLRQVRRNGHHLTEWPDDAPHALRNDAKKLRYAVEFIGSLYSAGGKRKRRRGLLAALEQLQEASWQAQ